ncbi:MAG: transglycosylase domain-containing protein, partial [Actinomycetota bacterium]
VAAEDRDFYDHEGVSIGGVVRAAWQNLTSGRVEQGGSTLSQQYVKNAVLEDPSRTISRKVKELILAIKLERRYSKNQILEFYVNTVYFGRGAYGIEAAARVYFAKHASQLTLPEAAYLAGLIPAPERYQVDSSRAAALARRSYVLEAMREEGYIDEAEERRADDAKLKTRIAAVLRPRRQEAAYFLEWLRKDYLYPRYGDCLYRCGLKIYTTIDMDMQHAAEEAIAITLDEPTDPPAALVSMTPAGEVRAMVGGRAFHSVRKARGFNFATDAKRQAGSAFKPFTLLTAIREDISTSSRFSGESPKTIEDPACIGPAGVWSPENYEGASYGTLDLNSATSSSVNTVFAELISEVGPEDVADLVERFGFSGPFGTGEIDPVCSLALGTLDVSSLEMARAFAGFAGRGVLPAVNPIRWVENGAGRCILGFGTPKKMNCRKVIDAGGERVVDANSTDILTQTLTGVIEGGTATSADIERPAAGKTGTTQNNRDAWFAGYTPQLATVVWMGYPIEQGPDGKFGTADDISPLMHYCSYPEICRPVHGIEVVGGSFPAAIWGMFMENALVDMEYAYFTTPVDEGDIVINPLPPPKPEPKGREGKEDKGNPHEDDGDSSKLDND